MDGAERANKAEKYGLEADIRDVAGRLILRKLELTLGKKMNFNLNIKTQEDLPSYRDLPPEVRAKFDEALDAMTIAQTRILPAKALSSGRVNE